MQWQQIEHAADAFVRRFPPLYIDATNDDDSRHCPSLENQMSYVDGNRTAPFGAITIYRVISVLADGADRLWGAVASRAVALSAFSPAQREDIGVAADHLRADRTAGFLASAAFAVREWDARRRTVAELSRLSDAQLDDIGLTRGDVDALRSGRPLR